jgi:acyl-CoA thioesterase-1
MKRKLFLPGMFSVMLAFVIIVIGCDNGTGINDQAAPLVCFGNSLTAGYGATTPGRDDKAKSYPAFLQKKVNIPVINAGVSGDTTADGLARIDADVISKNPQIVIIELGANDFGLPISTIKNNLQSIISKLNNGSRKIYLTRFYTEAFMSDLAGALNLSNAQVAALITQYDGMFRSLASSNNIELIEDIWSGVWGIHMSDEVHPNAKGYEIMADNYFRILQPYLQQNNLIKR